ncbi:MAG: tRNA (N6-isopentenyl adenosine(37)-C2)-methylthiotransferase MiaB, partial [Gammaproteobacteria bacterium]|nr:tRNA (N6-isopentenyl adenosine(37)-C2)-methylthiotransferase MiaB [Gammaproteobacteria bacterium]
FPEIEKFDCLPPRQVDGPRAFVSIMEGCSKYCSFCVVPYTRGEEYSRPFDSVITEIYELAEQGVREVTLLGQNVNAYHTVNHRGESIDFATLLRYVNEIEGIGRIRYTTSHPLEFTNELARAHGELPSLAKHLHLPVQSGSDKILARMKRRYTRKDYLQIIENVRSYCPQISISSDFIVGFPGETAHDFRQTMDLIDEVEFDHSFSFLYSKRPGTPAALLQDETSEEEKKERLYELQARINSFAITVSDAMVNTVQAVLVDGVSRRRDSQVCGRTENNRVVNFDGPEAWQGQFVDVLITAAMPNSLRGIAQSLHQSQEFVSN